MARKFTRKRTKNTRRAYSYKPQDSLNDAEKRVYRRLILAFIVIFGISGSLFIWGTDLVYSINSFWRNYFPAEQTTSVTGEDPALLLAPRIDPLAQYTHLDKANINGWAQAGTEVAIYINDQRIAKVLVDKNGRFEYTGAQLAEGENVVYAKTSVGENEGDPSQSYLVHLDVTPPTLEYTLGEVNSEELTVDISGTVEENSSLFINSRRIIVQTNGSFLDTLSLHEGENTINLRLEDIAGNSTEKNDSVTVDAPATPDKDAAPDETPADGA